MWFHHWPIVSGGTENEAKKGVVDDGVDFYNKSISFCFKVSLDLIFFSTRSVWPFMRIDASIGDAFN